MAIALDVNPAFEQWKSSMGKEKEWALHMLIQRLERFATAVCWRRLPDHRDEFGPLVNEIVWRAIKYAPKFKNTSKFSTWFYRIAVNRCNTFLRSHKQRLETSLEDEQPQTIAGVEARMDLIAILNALNGDDHLLFRMVAEGQDFKTIAEALGLKRNAAIVRWNRLKARLRNAAI